jgi:hypothetical protein
MTARDPSEYRAVSASDERFREDLLQEFFEFRKDARLHLRSMDSGLSIFRGEANAYQRTFTSATRWTRSLLLILVALHMTVIALLIYFIVEGS